MIISRPPSDVWCFVSDLATTPTWRTKVTSIEPPDTLQLGQQFAATTRLLGRTWRWALELTELDEGRVLSYAVVRGVAKPHVSYLIEPDPGGTRFTMTGSVEPTGFGTRLLTRLARPALRRETTIHLSNLKRLLELESRTAPYRTRDTCRWATTRASTLDAVQCASTVGASSGGDA